MQVSSAHVDASNPYTVRMYSKALNVQRQEGQAAVSLIEQSGELQAQVSRPEGTKGHILSTVA